MSDCSRHAFDVPDTGFDMEARNAARLLAHMCDAIDECRDCQFETNYGCMISQPEVWELDDLGRPGAETDTERADLGHVPKVSAISWDFDEYTVKSYGKSSVSVYKDGHELFHTVKATNQPRDRKAAYRTLCDVLVLLDALGAEVG